MINGDGVYYSILGERFVSGDFDGAISAYWSPIYSILTGISSLFFYDSVFAGRFVSLITGSLLVVPVYLLIRDFYGRIAAYLGAVLVIFNPVLILASGWVMTESIYALTFTTCVLFGWYALRDGRTMIFFVTGLLLGAAFLIKPEAIGFLGLMIILTIGAVLFRPGINFRSYFAGFLFLVLGFMVFFLPYFLFLNYKTGQWTISQKILGNFPVINYEIELLKLDDSRQMTMKDRIWGDYYETEYIYPAASSSTPAKSFDLARLRSDLAIHSSKVLNLSKEQVRDYFPELLSYPFYLLILIGFFVIPWTRERTAKEFYLFAFLICTLLGYAASIIEQRYLYPIIPILIAWTASGIVGFSDWALKSAASLHKATRPIKPVSVEVFVLILLVASLGGLFKSNFFDERYHKTALEEKEAGLWIRDQSDGTTPLVMSSHVLVAFYAGAKHIYLPDEKISTVLEYANRRKVNYLIFNTRRTNFTPTLFADKDAIPQELEVVYRNMKDPENEITVYRLTN